MAVYGTNILITFNMLVDTDLGLLHIIKDKYNDPDVFDSDVLNLDEKILKGLLQMRPFRNPLMIIMKDKNEEQADVFLKELMLTEYENITRSSKPTTLIEVVKRFIDASANMRIEILCMTKLEAGIISNLMDDYPAATYKLIIQSEHADVDLSSYDTMFINYLDELLEFDVATIDGKNIMVTNHYFNLNPEMFEEKRITVKDEYAVLFGSRNEFYTVSLYNYDESYYLD